jgi:hypothetical protein
LRLVNVLRNLTQLLNADRSPGSVVENDFAHSRIDTAIQFILAFGLSGLIFSGFGGLIYGFYSLCLENLSKVNVYFSAATTSLK